MTLRDMVIRNTPTDAITVIMDSIVENPSVDDRHLIQGAKQQQQPLTSSSKTAIVPVVSPFRRKSRIYIPNASSSGGGVNDDEKRSESPSSLSDEEHQSAPSLMLIMEELNSIIKYQGNPQEENGGNLVVYRHMIEEDVPSEHDAKPLDDPSLPVQPDHDETTSINVISPLSQYSSPDASELQKKLQLSNSIIKSLREQIHCLTSENDSLRNQILTLQNFKQKSFHFFLKSEFMEEKAECIQEEIDYYRDLLRDYEKAAATKQAMEDEIAAMKCQLAKLKEESDWTEMQTDKLESEKDRLKETIEEQTAGWWRPKRIASFWKKKAVKDDRDVKSCPNFNQN